MLGDGRSPPPDPDPGPAVFGLDFPRKGSVAVGQRARGLCLGPARPDRLTGGASGRGSAATLAAPDTQGGHHAQAQRQPARHPIRRRPAPRPADCREPHGQFESRSVFLLYQRLAGGGGGIRTHGTLTRTTVFETAPFDHSGTPPRGHPLVKDREASAVRTGRRETTPRPRGPQATPEPDAGPVQIASAAAIIKAVAPAGSCGRRDRVAGGIVWPAGSCGRRDRVE